MTDDPERIEHAARKLRAVFGAGFLPMAFRGRNPMPKPCKDCPFVLAARGQDYLAEGRLDGIKFAVGAGQPFPCHKSIYQDAVPTETDPETGIERRPSWHRRYQQCAGAIAFAEKLRARMERP